jgi:hypothetical protein
MLVSVEKALEFAFADSDVSEKAYGVGPGIPLAF